MCVSSRARSGSHASSYLMPRHPWMISTWPRVDVGLLHCSDSLPLCWSCVVAEGLKEHIFFIKSLFLITFRKKYLLRARLWSFIKQLLRVRVTQITSDWWKHGMFLCLAAQSQTMYAGAQKEVWRVGEQQWNPPCGYWAGLRPLGYYATENCALLAQ